MSAPENTDDSLLGLNPADLLARGLATQKIATGNPQAWQPPTPEELAALLPQYEIESLLGRGGMGAVYRGKQAALDRAVAIKLLPAELAADAEFLTRFQREARTLAKLQHPGIVAVHDFGQTSAGHLYFVMEFVDGTDLARLIHGPGVNPAQALEIVTQICDALQYAHSQGVIHRDIKPANVLINLEGRAKLADFGLARPTDEDSGALTRSNVVMGTPDYIAPEQMYGNADHRADLYALGVMLYEMLTGQTPRGAWAPPSQRVQVDVRLDQVVVRALQQDPAMRYQQASEIKTDVDVIRTTPLPKAGKAKTKSASEAPGQRTTPLPKAKKPGNRLALAAIIVLPLLALAGWWVEQNHEASSSPAPTIPWTRVERTAKEWMKTGQTLKDGWVHNPGKNIVVFDRLSAAKATSHFAIRAKVKFHESESNLNFVNQTGSSRTFRKIQFYSHKQTILNSDHPPGTTQRHESKVEIDEEASVEILVAGDKVYTRFNGQPVVVSDLSPAIPWEQCLVMGGGSFSLHDLEYAILDGIADPLKALGWEVPQENASKPAIAAPSDSVLKARTDGGSLKVWGKSRRGEPALGGATEMKDFAQVALDSEGWAAKRTGDSEVWMADWPANSQVKAQPAYRNRARSVSRSGRIAVLTSPQGQYRDPTYFDGKVSRPDAVTLLKVEVMPLWLGTGGAILANGTRSTTAVPPRADFFVSANAYTASEHRFIAARRGAKVESWEAATGQKHEFSLSADDVLEMDAAADFVVILTKDGQVRLFMDDGRPMRSADSRITKAPSGSGPFVAVRAGRGMVAAQKPDGSWVAWGESDALAQKVGGLGHVIDLDLDYDPKESELLLWIEPVDRSASNAPTPASPTSVADAKKRLVEARAHLKAGDTSEARKMTEEALATAPGDLGVMADAALLLAEVQAPERAMTFAGEFVKQAPAEHPQFAAITELRVKLGATMKQYQARLDAAAKLVAVSDDATELRELQMALQFVPDGREAAARLEKNPLHIGRPLPGRRWAGPLGHTYVPVDGLANELFSTWETRVKDFEQFVKETGHDMSQRRTGTYKEFTWKKPGFEQTGDHPVVMVSRDDADAFCRWLTKKERAAGRLLPGQVYRLPTDREWSAAMGVLNEPGDFPEDRRFPQNIFTWEEGVPPPRNAENSSWKNDDYPNTAPVGSGLANRFGLYDLIGNVKEICADPWAFNNPQIVLRGGSFLVPESWAHQRETLSGGPSGLYHIDRAKPDAGFRCVLDLKSETMRRVQTDLEAAVEKFHANGGAHREEINTLATDDMVLLDLSGWGYPSSKALQAFADLPVTHVFVRGGSLRKPFDAFKKMPLRVLSLDTLYPEKDFLETLRGLPLQWLLLKQHPDSKFAITSLAQLEGMKLKGLHMENFKNIESLEPLRGMPLEILFLERLTTPASLQPLKGSKVRRLMMPESAPLSWLMEANACFPDLESVSGYNPQLFADAFKEALAKGDDRAAMQQLNEMEKAFAGSKWWQGESGKWLRTGYEYAVAEARLASVVRRWQEGGHVEIVRNAKVFNNHAYLLVKGALRYSEARHAAEMMGAHLVTVTSAEENEFLKREFMTTNDSPREILIGAKREGTERGWHGWQWVTGEDFAFTDWQDPEWSAKPDALGYVGLHCAAGKGKWWWGGSDFRQAIVIEWDTPTPQPTVKK